MKISFYLPPYRPIPDAVGQLKFEMGMATNIKDDAVRGKILDGLRTVIDKLTGMNKVPDNGVVIFANGRDSRIVIPEKPLQVNAYFSDDEYVEKYLP
jgi:peptide chain release factor subunit 1